MTWDVRKFWLVNDFCMGINISYRHLSGVFTSKFKQALVCSLGLQDPFLWLVLLNVKISLNRMLQYNLIFPFALDGVLAPGRPNLTPQKFNQPNPQSSQLRTFEHLFHVSTTSGSRVNEGFHTHINTHKHFMDIWILGGKYQNSIAQTLVC